MTPIQIQQAGLTAITRELGVVGMIRFIQQYELGEGNYTAERSQWLDQFTVDDVANLLREKDEKNKFG